MDLKPSVAAARSSSSELAEEYRLPLLPGLVVRLWGLTLELVTRAADLLLLSFRPRLLAPYLAMWLAALRRSPYAWPRSFEAVRLVKSTGQSLRELMYGEVPLVTGVWLLWRAGARQGSRVVDVGAGRGRLLLAARWLGAEARGIELLETHVNAVQSAMHAAGATLVVGDAGEADYRGATHVFLNWCAFADATKARVRERLLGCAPGTRVLAVVRAVEGAEFPVRARRWALFTWGVERVFVQERASHDGEPRGAG